MFSKGTDPDKFKLLVEEAWKNREEITQVINDKMVRVKELINLNFEIVRGIVDLDRNERDCIPEEISDAWIPRGE